MEKKVNDEHDCAIEIKAKFDGLKYELSCEELDDGFSIIYFGNDEPSREVWRVCKL